MRPTIILISLALCACSTNLDRVQGEVDQAIRETNQNSDLTAQIEKQTAELSSLIAAITKQVAENNRESAKVEEQVVTAMQRAAEEIQRLRKRLAECGCE